MNLRVDQVVLERGASATREIVEHRGAAAIVPLLDGDRVILVRQYRYAVGTDLLEVPAGTLEPGEMPDACARRELEEETGYKCTELRKFLECFIAPGYSTEKIYFYLAKGLARSQPMTEEDELIRLEEMPVKVALQKIRSGEIIDSKTVCALYRAAELLGETKS